MFILIVASLVAVIIIVQMIPKNFGIFELFSQHKQPAQGGMRDILNYGGHIPASAGNHMSDTVHDQCYQYAMNRSKVIDLNLTPCNNHSYALIRSDQPNCVFPTPTSEEYFRKNYQECVSRTA